MVLRNYNASTQSRSGTLTEVVEDIELESQGFRSISKQVIPYVRSKTINISAKSMKPFTKLFVYFDKQDVVYMSLRQQLEPRELHLVVFLM